MSNRRSPGCIEAAYALLFLLCLGLLLWQFSTRITFVCSRVVDLFGHELDPKAFNDLTFEASACFALVASASSIHRVPAV